MQLVALAGFAIGALLVLGVSYLQVRKFRAHMSGLAFRRMYVQTLTRVGGWSVGSYLVWFIFISPILSMMGVHIPKAH